MAAMPGPPAKKAPPQRGLFVGVETRPVGGHRHPRQRCPATSLVVLDMLGELHMHRDGLPSVCFVYLLALYFGRIVDGWLQSLR